MDDDLPTADALAELVTRHWAPEPGDAGSFLAALERRRRRRSRSADLLALAAVAGAATMLLATSPPDGASGWLATTCFAGDHPPLGDASLAAIRATFLIAEAGR